MKQKNRKSLLALVLVTALLLGVYSGCARVPAQQSPSSEQQDENDRTEADRCGAAWTRVFGDKTLPKSGWLEPDQVGFYRTGEDGKATVIVMTVDEMQEKLSALGNLPRTDYYERMLDERFSLLFSTFDKALELGCAKFALPTTLSSREASDAADYIDSTFLLYGFQPNYTATQDLTDENGETFRFLTVNFTCYTQQMVEMHHRAVEECRAMIAEMVDLDEIYKAALLYFAAATIAYDGSLEYVNGKQLPLDWCTLYEAVINNVGPRQAFAIQLNTLFNLAGIDCIYASGSTTSTSVGATFYTWNVAQLQGTYYVFDPFIDNLMMTGENADSWAWGVCFAMTDERANEIVTHIPGLFYKDKLPACTEEFEYSGELPDPPKPV